MSTIHKPLTAVEEANIRGAIADYQQHTDKPFERMVFEDTSWEWYNTLSQQLGMGPMPLRDDVHNTTPPPPNGGSGDVPLVITELAWPFQEIAPMPMVCGTRYAFHFRPSANYGGKSIGFNEFESQQRMRYARICSSPNGDGVLRDAQGQPAVTYGIGGILIFGSGMGQIPLVPEMDYYAVIDMVGTDGLPSGPAGTDATAVIVLR